MTVLPSRPDGIAIGNRLPCAAVSPSLRQRVRFTGGASFCRDLVRRLEQAIQAVRLHTADAEGHRG